MKYVVSEKYAGKIMQVVNTFFKKPSAILHPNRIKNTPIFENGELVSFETITYDQYQPQLGFSCGWHGIRKDELWKDKVGTPVLAISSKYASSCLPLYAGDIVEIKGTHQLTVRQIEGMKKVGCTPSVTVFVRRENSEEEIEKEYINLLNGYMFDFELYDSDMMGFERHSYSETSRICSEMRSQVMMNIDCSFAKEMKVLEREEESLTVFLVRDLEVFKEKGTEVSDPEVFVRYEVRNSEGTVLRKSTFPSDIASFIAKQTKSEEDIEDEYDILGADSDYSFDECCEELPDIDSDFNIDKDRFRELVQEKYGDNSPRTIAGETTITLKKLEEKLLSEGIDPLSNTEYVALLSSTKNKSVHAM